MGDPVRVLNVVVNMNRGGAETLLMNLYRNLDRTRIQFDFLTCKPGVFDKEIQELGGVIHRIPYISDVGHFGYIKALKQFFSVHQEYKILHSHLDKMSGVVLREAKKVGIPIRISHSHNTQSEGGRAAKLYKWYVGKLILPNATNYFACSSEAAQWLYSKRFNMVTVLKNGIEYEKFAFNQKVRDIIREELGIADDTCVFGHIGRFNHQKNHTFLLDLFAEFHRKQPQSTLILIGDGPLRSEMELKARSLGLEGKVMFLGIRSDIDRLLQAFDAFLFPSIHEGLPVSLIEAQGAGLPCIIADHISPEVDLGKGLIDYAPISSLDNWVGKMKGIVHVKNSRNRHLETDTLSSKGFDIKETASELEKYYKSLVRDTI